MIKEHQRAALKRLYKFVNISGKSVLEIGTENNYETLKQVLKYEPLSLCGVNYDHSYSKNEYIAANCYFRKMDARNLTFLDSSFDIVFSISTFEHIQDLDRALAEIFRVLKPGGKLFSYFGPIWSCYLGHHLYANHEGEVASFESPEKNPFPDLGHLYMSENEIRELLLKKYCEEMTEKIVNMVFYSDEINRMFYEDYIRIFEKSPFEILWFDEFWQKPIDDNTKKKLRKFGPKKNWDCCGIELLFEKPEIK